MVKGSEELRIEKSSLDIYLEASENYTNRLDYQAAS